MTFNRRIKEVYVVYSSLEESTAGIKFTTFVDSNGCFKKQQDQKCKIQI